MATSHWADEAAAKIIREKGDKDCYTCASGITPSGIVHIGNFREIISVELVVRALRQAGKAVRFIYSWDDYDVFRKVPPDMPGQDALAASLRLPITMVADPWGRDESYARHNEVDVEAVLPVVGVKPEYIYQTKRYRAATYADGVRAALEKRELLRTILDKFRDEEHKIQGQWWPVSVFCDKCNHDETDITGYDGDWGLSYHCNHCGNEETADLRRAGGVKLLWRVDWPMRWAYEKVDFEPAGKDHHSQGGSFDTARLVSTEVYGYDAPVTFRYDFIGIKGSAGKMSSSKGNVVALSDLLRVYTPEIVRYMFAGTRPNTEFTISFDLDVIKIYEDYDKTERIAWGVEAAKDEAARAKEKRIYELSQVDEGMPAVMPYQVPLRHLCSLLQIADCDIDRTIAALPATGLSPLKPEQADKFRARCRCALYWIAECAPEDFRFRLRLPRQPQPPQQELRTPSGQPEQQPQLPPLSAAELSTLALLRDDVVARIETFADDKACASAIYEVAAAAGLEGKQLFRAAYVALIGKESGPRLAAFLRSIDKGRLLSLLVDY
jgi:lysyl-tRNA synthetase class 1